MLQQILKRLAEQIAYGTKDVAKLLALLFTAGYVIHMTATDKSPVLFLILIAWLIYFPLSLIIIYVLLLIPKIVCIIVLQMLHIDNKENFNNFNFHFEYESNGYRSREQQNQYESYNSYDRQNWQKTEENNQQQSRTGRKDELGEALDFYGLKIPFTEEQLRDKRRKLMKTAHPDEGGNTETAADINRYFDILKKYAS